MLKLTGKVRVFENKSKNGKYYFSTSLGSKSYDVWYNFNVFVSIDKKIETKWVDCEGYAYVDLDVKESYVNFTTKEVDKKQVIDTINVFIYEVNDDDKKDTRRKR